MKRGRLVYWLGAAVLSVLLATFLIAHADPFGSSSGAFTGTWQGEDADDGSTVTVVVTQQGNQLAATFTDGFSIANGQSVPGYSGSGTGTAAGSTATLTFSLARSDGSSVQMTAHFTLSGSVIQLTVSQWNEHTLSPAELWANLQKDGASGSASSSTSSAGSAVQVGSLWLDTFDANLLAHDWWWVRESSSKWNLSPAEGMLNVTTEYGGLYGTANNGRNILLREAPNGDFILETHVYYQPAYNFQNAGIIVYGDDDNYLMLSRAYCEPCGGNKIYFDYEKNGQALGTGVGLSTSRRSEAYLKIVKQGTTFSGYYSDDGRAWQQVGVYRNVGVHPTGVGIASIGSGEDALPRTAEFDYLAVDTEVTSASATGASIAIAVSPVTPDGSISVSPDLIFTIPDTPWQGPTGGTPVLPPGGITLVTDLAIEIDNLCLKPHPSPLAFSFQVCGSCTVSNVSAIASGDYNVQFYFRDTNGAITDGTIWSGESGLGPGQERDYYYCSDYIVFTDFPVSLLAVVPKLADEDNTSNNSDSEQIAYTATECP